MFNKKQKCPCNNFILEIKDGYQFCLDCGKAHLVPYRNPEKGGHNLKIVDTSTIVTFASMQQRLTTQSCSKCGTLFTYNETVGRYVDKHPSDVYCR